MRQRSCVSSVILLCILALSLSSIGLALAQDECEGYICGTDKPVPGPNGAHARDVEEGEISPRNACKISTQTSFKTYSDGDSMHKAPCVSVKSACSYKVQISVRIAGAAPQTQTLEPRESVRKCAATDKQSIEYMGWKKLGAAGKFRR